MSGKHRTGVLVLALAISLLTGCAFNSVPVVNEKTPTTAPLPAQTAAPTETPSEPPLSIIFMESGVEVTPKPVRITPVASEDDYLLTIGKKAKGKYVLRIRVKNQTGRRIKKITIVPAGINPEKNKQKSLLSEGDIFTNNENRILYYNVAKNKFDGRIADSFHIRLVFEDDTGWTLTDIPLQDVKEAVFCSEEDICYIEYVSKESGELVSTKEYELAMLKQQQKKEDRTKKSAARSDEED